MQSWILTLKEYACSNNYKAQTDLYLESPL